MVFIEVVTAIGGCCSRRQLCGGAFSGGEGIGEAEGGGLSRGERGPVCTLPTLIALSQGHSSAVCVRACVCVCMRVCV